MSAAKTRAKPDKTYGRNHNQPSAPRPRRGRAARDIEVKIPVREAQRIAQYLGPERGVSQTHLSKWAQRLREAQGASASKMTAESPPPSDGTTKNVTYEATLNAAASA